ncbi:hypothetical protein [Streptomyces lydicus]|uniref:hypothetical protein n=1 Tax=Streptomyces lydicus TaxID=47763 RepID=UPI0037A1B8A5
MEAVRSQPQGDGHWGLPVHRLRLEKRRCAGHCDRFKSRNRTDSSGRLIREALEATAPARATLALLGEDTQRLLVRQQTTEHEEQG